MLDLDAIAATVDLPDADARAKAEARQLVLTKPTGSLGRLEAISVWLCGVQGTCPPRPFARPRVIVFAGDHGIAQHGVSAYPPDVTAQMVLNFLAGGAAVNALARAAGADVRVLDLAVDTDYSAFGGVPDDVVAHKVRRSSGSIDREDALTRDEVERAFAAGIAIADEEVDGGADLLIAGDMGIGNTTPTATLVALLTSSEIADVVGRGTGVDDDAWMRKCEAVRDAARRGRPHLGDPLTLLATVGGADLAAMTGFLLQAAVRRTPVILDGVVSGACALLAQRISYRAPQWWIAGHRSTEPAHHVTLRRLGLEPVVDYGMRLGEGTGALVALSVVNAAGATLREMATFDEAGVTDKQ